MSRRSSLPLLLLAALQFRTETPAAPIRALAQEHVVVAESPNPATTSLFTPSILRLPSGRLVASFEQGGAGRDQGRPNAVILTSDDHGRTWQPRGRVRMTHGRVFAAGKSLYYLGHEGDLRISRSDDAGETWSPPRDLTSGQSWHQTAANVWHARGHLYLVMERRVSRAIDGWAVGELAPILLRAAEDADLTEVRSWTFASELSFASALPGQAENYPKLDFFGVPFHQPDFPRRAPVAGSRATMAPMGWLETNVVQIMDPDHLWFDPSGHTFHLLARAHTGGTGYAALTKVVERDDGTLATTLERVPSGRTMLFLPFPGGQMRFHLLYDEPTKLYWLLNSQATDSMTRPERLPATRFGLPNNERHRLVLHFSRNLVDWCFAGLVAESASPKEARHYACMDIDGDDLVILSRSADRRARSAHDGNLITFHRVSGFRSLVY